MYIIREEGKKSVMDVLETNRSGGSCFLVWLWFGLELLWVGLGFGLGLVWFGLALAWFGLAIQKAFV